MPVYEYICGDCKHEFEELVMSSSEEVPCPKCNSSHTNKLLSRFAFKSGGVFRSASESSSSCAGCHPGAGGCSGCRH